MSKIIDKSLGINEPNIVKSQVSSDVFSRRELFKASAFALLAFGLPSCANVFKPSKETNERSFFVPKFNDDLKAIAFSKTEADFESLAVDKALFYLCRKLTSYEHSKMILENFEIEDTNKPFWPFLYSSLAIDTLRDLNYKSSMEIINYYTESVKQAIYEFNLLGLKFQNGLQSLKSNPGVYAKTLADLSAHYKLPEGFFVEQDLMLEYLFLMNLLESENFKFDFFAKRNKRNMDPDISFMKMMNTKTGSSESYAKLFYSIVAEFGSPELLNKLHFTWADMDLVINFRSHFSSIVPVSSVTNGVERLINENDIFHLQSTPLDVRTIPYIHYQNTSDYEFFELRDLNHVDFIGDNYKSMASLIYVFESYRLYFESFFQINNALFNKFPNKFEQSVRNIYSVLEEISNRSIFEFSNCSKNFLSQLYRFFSEHDTFRSREYFSIKKANFDCLYSLILKRTQSLNNHIEEINNLIGQFDRMEADQVNRIKELIYIFEESVDSLMYLIDMSKTFKYYIGYSEEMILSKLHKTAEAIIELKPSLETKISITRTNISKLSL